MKKLINRPPIYKDECLSSYLYRLSKANYFSGPSPILKQLKIELFHFKANQFDINSCKEISKICDLSPEQLFKASNSYYEENLKDTVEKMVLLKGYVKYCPCCIKENYYFKNSWFLNLYTVCLEHQSLLLQNCQGCGNTIPLENFLAGFCKQCNFEFDKAYKRLVQSNSLLYKSQFEFQSIIEGKMGEVLKNISSKDLFEFIKGNLHIIEDLKSRVNNQTIHLITHSQKYFLNENFGEALANIYWMYTNFPFNFFQRLDEFFMLPFDKRKRRKKEFELILDKFSFLKNAYQQYQNNQILRGNVPRNISSFDLEASKKVRKRYITKKEIKKEFNLSRQDVDFICSNLTPNRDQREKIYFRRFDLEEVSHFINKFKYEKKNLLTKKEAAIQLGIHLDIIPSLLKKDLLREIAFMSKNFICKESLKILQKTFDIEPKSSNEKYVPYHRVFDLYATNGISATSLIEKLRMKEITAYTNKNSIKISDFWFLETDIKNVLSEIAEKAKSESGMNLKEVARNLQIGESTIKILIKHGLLKCQIVRYKSFHNKKYIFKKEEINKFKEKYLTTDQAALLYNQSPSYFRNLVHRGKLNNQLKGICTKQLLIRKEVDSLISAKKQKNE
jgi:hypothetical protein